MYFKSFLLFLLAVSLITCKTDRRTPFKIIGKVKNLDGTNVSLEQFGIVHDVGVIKNDTFSLSANLTSLEMCDIKFKGDGHLTSSGISMKWLSGVIVFVENGAHYKISANNSNDILSKSYQIESSSVQQNIWNAYNTMEQQERKLIKEKLNELDVKSSIALKVKNDDLYDVYLDSMQVYEDKLKQSRHTTYRKLLAKNPNTYAAIYILSTSYDIPNDINFYKSIYSRLNKEFKNHDYGKTFKKKLDEVKEN